MRLNDTFVTATQSLGRRKVRTVLTSIGVFVGIITIVTMVSLGIGIQKQVTDTIQAFGLETVFVNAKVQRQPASEDVPTFTRTHPQKPITQAVVESFKTLPGVKSVDVWVAMPAAPDLTLTLDGKTFAATLRDADPRARLFSPTVETLAGQIPAETPGARGLVVTSRLLSMHGFGQDYASVIGKEVTLGLSTPRGDKTTLPTRIVAVTNALGPAVDMGNADKIDLLKWWFNDPNILQSEGYTSAIVHAASIGDASRLAGQVNGMGFDASSLQALLDQANRVFSILQVMLSSIGLLALLVASIGIANTMIMSIYERTREIGVLKAVGGSNGDVLRMFVVEAGLIGLLGGIVGVVGGWLLGLGLNWGILQYLKSQSVPISAPFFVVTWDLVAEALVFATLVGIVAGLYPAFRAARLDPLAALRHE